MIRLSAALLALATCLVAPAQAQVQSNNPANPLAGTAYVDRSVQTLLTTVTNAFAPKANPNFTGTATVPALNLTGTGSTGPVDGMTVTPNAGAPDGTLARLILNALPSGRRAVETGDASGLTALATGAQTAVNLADIAARLRSYKDYGLVCDGVAIEGVKINTALALIGGLGGGTLNIADRRCRTGPTNIIVPRGVAIAGNRTSAPILTTTGGYDQLPSALVFPATGGYGAFVQARGALRDMAVLTDGLQLPGAAQQAMNIVAGWQGIGVTVGSDADQAHNASLDNVLVMGFNKGVQTKGSSQIRMRHVFVDAVNGFAFDGSRDNSICDDCRAFPQFTSYQPWTTVDMAVTGAIDNGSGAIRLTVNSTAGFTNGLIGFVTGVGGTTVANGKWTFNIIDGTHLDLVGSSFAGTYTSGGRVRVNANKRFGTAFSFNNSDGDTCKSCFSYGYSTGFYATGASATTGANGVALYDSGTDDDLSLDDPTRTGILIDGYADRFQMTGGAISSARKAIAINSNATVAARPHNFINVQIGATGQYALDLTSGSVGIVGSSLVGGAPIRFGSGATALSLSGTASGGSTIAYDNAADAAKVCAASSPGFGVWACGPVTGTTGTFSGIVSAQHFRLGINGQVSWMAGSTNAAVFGSGDANGVNIEYQTGGTGTHLFRDGTGVLRARLGRTNAPGDFEAGISASGGIGLRVTPTGNQVNLFSFTGSTAGVPLTVAPAADSADANLSVNIQGKGTSGIRLGVFSRTNDPNTGDIPAGLCADWSNTAAGTLKRVCNVAGTLRSIAYQ